MWVFGPPCTPVAPDGNGSFFDVTPQKFNLFFALARWGMMSNALTIALNCTGMQTGAKRRPERMDNMNPDASHACPNKPRSCPDDTAAPSSSGSTKTLVLYHTTAQSPASPWKESSKNLASFRSFSTKCGNFKFARTCTKYGRLAPRACPLRPMETLVFLTVTPHKFNFFAPVLWGMMSNALAIVLDRAGMQTGGK